MKLVGVLFLIGVAAINSNTIDYDGIIASIPEDERMDFVKFHLRLGYDLLKTAEQYVNREEIPEDFSVGLYNHMKSTNEIKDETVLRQLSELICFDDGSCIEIGDPGVHP